MPQSQQYEGPNRREAERWKFDKRVSVTDIVTIAMATLAIFYAYTTLDKRQTLTEAATVALAKKDADQDVEANRWRDRSTTQYDTINRKLDRLIERGGVNR